MDNILGRERDDVYMANIIKGNIVNADEVLKSDAEVTFEESIRKGEVEVLTMDDIKESYNNTFYKGEDIATVEANIDALIQKGSEHYLEEEEFELLEKAMYDFSRLDRKAVAVQSGGTQKYREIFVMKTTDTDNE